MIAIDGGGTKTETILLDTGGHILARDVTTGCNALDLGPETAGALLVQAVQRVRAHAPGKIAAIFGGIAGNCHVGPKLLQILQARLPAQRLEICDDTWSVISSALGRRDGCGLVAGTGSSLFIRAEGHPWTHIGGWGYLLDTGGSGYDLGRDALYMALRAADGRGEKTVLNQLLAQALHRRVEEGIAELYAGGRPLIASLARTVFEGRRMGDPVCEAIMQKGASHLAEMVSAAERYCPAPYPVVLGGGLFAAFPEYVEALRSKVSSQAELLSSYMPVIYGAAVEALWLVGQTPSVRFQQQFYVDYQLYHTSET